MNVLALIHGIGSVGIFASRAFLPAFLTALLLRFGPQIPWLAGSGLFNHVTGTPTWFTHDITIIVLGILAALEIAATKSPEARELLTGVDKYLKTGVATAVNLGVISTVDAQFVRDAVQTAGPGDYIALAVVAGGVFLLSTLRQQAMSLLTDSDGGDDLGIQKLISWGEDIWTIVGVFVLLIYPIVMLVLIGLVTVFLFLAAKYAQRREEQAKVPCRNCGELIYPCAMACPACGTAVDAPRALGFLGASLKEPAGDLGDHPFRLVEKKRCPVCAARFPSRALRQKCAACGHELFADAAFVDRYTARVGRRLPRVLLICFLFSLVPIVGLIPGVIYYRVALAAPFGRYIPWGRRFVLKWGMRLFFFVLIAFQWVPLLGGAVVPVMAMVSFLSYRSSFLSLALSPSVSVAA